jgi:hypothetical protein
LRDFAACRSPKATNPRRSPERLEAPAIYIDRQFQFRAEVKRENYDIIGDMPWMASLMRRK